ncbi:hypothetical protein ACWELJ_26845, partial [Nocardia sp. NPDC004582]
MTEPGPDRPPESPAAPAATDPASGKLVAPQADRTTGGRKAAERAAAAARAKADARAAEADAGDA